MSKIDKLFKKAYLHVPIYGATVYFFTSRKKYQKAKEHLGKEVNLTGIDGRVACMTHKDGYDIYLIGVFTSDLPTLVHEVTHLTLMIAENAGIQAYDSVSEPICYLNGYLFKELHVRMSSAE